ncbi:MAG: protein kinase domain-containing protein [Planctomycetota bacterium]|jgi:non-specific serine/threonine protein kinase
MTDTTMPIGDGGRRPPYLYTSLWGEGDARFDPEVFPEWLGDGTFRRDAPLGEGGMGVVFRYRDTRLDRLVAVKTLPAHLSEHDDRRQRFEGEARALAALNHPNIGGIHQLLEHDGRTYLILEYVAGHTLAELLRDDPPPLEKTLYLCGQVARAIEAGHAHRVVHRDIKPGNIMITPDPVAKLLDYGLAWYGATRPAADADAPWPVSPVDATQPGAVMGTAGYMSPEQARGEETDERADIWAFGCVLFECLAGAAAFAGTSREERLRATLEDEPPWERLPPGTSASIRRILEDCLRKRRAERPALMTEVRTALAQITSAAPVAPKRGGPVRHNLPTELSPFVGRERELARIRTVLARTRLLTLVGPGGAGKTRTALRCAREALAPTEEWTGVAPYPDGVFLVELSTVKDERVDAAVLGVLPWRDAPPGDRSSTETLVEVLRERRVLLVLDTCEHVVDPCAAVVLELLRHCPMVSVLATSREPLGVEGEQLDPINGLECPARDADRDAIDESDAVQLFVARAGSVRPSFRLDDAARRTVAEICRRVEGIPLAIELAASRVKTIPLARIEEHLLDVLDPEHVLDSSIDWSVKLLDESSRTLLGRLAVFHGGWTLEAVEAVCGAGEGDLEVIEQLSRLVDKSLVMYAERGDRARYHLLDTVAAYAGRHLADARDPGDEERHLRYYEELALRANEHFAGPEQAAWLDRIETEHNNLRAACAASRTEDVDPERGALLATAMYPFWFVRGYVSEGRTILERALARRDGACDLAQMRALNAAATLAQSAGDTVTARRHYDAALGIASTMGDKKRMAGILTNLGMIGEQTGDLGFARRCQEDSLRLYKDLGDEVGLARVQLNLGYVALLEESEDECLRLLGACLPVFRSGGDGRRIAATLVNLGRVSTRRGHLDEALKDLRESLALSHKLGDRKHMAHATLRLGIAWQMKGDYALAARFLAAAGRMHEMLGQPIAKPDRAEYEQSLTIVRKNLVDADFDSAQSEGSAASFTGAAERVIALVGESLSPRAD